MRILKVEKVQQCQSVYEISIMKTKNAVVYRKIEKTERKKVLFEFLANTVYLSQI